MKYLHRYIHLTSFDERFYKEDACASGGIDCFGLCKTQKGFDGFIVAA
jgi:hypothetical protein